MGSNALLYFGLEFYSVTCIAHQEQLEPGLKIKITYLLCLEREVWIFLLCFLQNRLLKLVEY